jgi:hypothetical protein
MLRNVEELLNEEMELLPAGWMWSLLRERSKDSKPDS